MTDNSSYILEWRKVGKKNFLYQIEIKTKMLLVHGELLCTNKWLTTDNWYDINSILSMYTDKYFKDNRHMESNTTIDEIYNDLVNENILIKVKFDKVNPYFKRFFKLREKFYDNCMNVEIIDSNLSDKNEDAGNKKSTRKYNDNYIPECLASNKSSQKEQCNYTPSKKGEELLNLKNESYEPESMLKNIEESISEEVVYKPSSTSNDNLNDSDSDRYSPKPISNESIVLPNKVYTPTKIDCATTSPPTTDTLMEPSSSNKITPESTDTNLLKKIPPRKCRSLKINYNDKFTCNENKRKQSKKVTKVKEESSNDSKKESKRIYNDLFSSDDGDHVDAKKSNELKNTGDNNNNNPTDLNKKKTNAKKDQKLIKEEKYMKKKYKIKRFKDNDDFFAGKRFCDYLNVETIINTFNEFLPILMEEYNNYCKNKVHYIVEHQKPDKNIILEVYKIFHCDKVVDMIQYIKKYFINIKDDKDVDHDEFVYNGATPEWCLFIMMKELQLNRIDAIIKLKE